MARPRRLAKIAAAVSIALFAASSVQAHEFWIEPTEYQVAVGDKIEARLKNGQDFKGSTYPYLSQLFSRFELTTRSGTKPVTGRNGDNPAIDQEAMQGGLHVFSYDSKMYELVYKDYQQFADFVTSKGLGWVLDAHKARGLSEEKIVETYYRYPKALVKVGSGAGRDKPVGQVFEFVAEINPYSDAAKDGVRVQLLYEGAPFPGADVQIFHFPAGEDAAVKDHVTTDATGRAVIPVFDGGPFLINATHLREPRPEGLAKNADWESLWASMTYELPK